MATLPVFFRKTKANNLINFSFVDWVANVGYGTYYATFDREGNQYLTPLVIETDREYWLQGAAAANGIERNFDLTFTKSATIQGKLFISCTYGGIVSASTSFFDISIVHVSTGNVETTIGTNQTTETYSATPGAGVTSSHRKTLVFDIARTNFGVGEKLRIVATATLTGGGHVWYDAADRANTGNDTDSDGSSEDLNDQSTTFKVLVPFRLTS